MALVSVSWGSLFIAGSVLDGGICCFLAGSLKGKPVSERIQTFLQQVVLRY